MSNNQLRYVILVGLFAVPFIPLYVAKSLLFPFITGKAFAFRIIIELIFACWLVLALKAPEYRPKFSWIIVSVFAFLVAIGIADFFSVNPFKSFWSNYERMEGYIDMLHLAAYFFVLTGVFSTKYIWYKFFATNVGASAFMAIYSFLQIAGKITINQGGVRVDGTFGNATYLAIYMVFAIFLAAYLYINTKVNWHKILLAVVTLADLVVLYYTATRGAILGLIGGAFLTFLLLLIKSHKGDKIRKIALGSIIGIVALVGLFLIMKNSPAVVNNPVLGRFSTLSLSELQTQGRFYVWPIAWKGFLEKPVFGWGQESFNFVFNKYYNPKMYTQEPWFDRTHDIVLDWLIAGGLVGFLAYASMFAALLYLLFKKSNFSKTEKAVLFGLISGYVFHNIFVFDQIGSYILFFAVLAFIHWSAEATSEKPAWVRKITDSTGKIFLNKSMFPVWSSLIVLATAGTLYFWQYIPIKANENIINVLTESASEQTVPVAAFQSTFADYNMGFPEALEHVSQVAIQESQNTQLDATTKQQIFNTVDAAFKEQMVKVPGDARYRLFYGMYLSNFGDYNDALVQLTEASKLSPGKQTMYFEVGSNLLAEGKNQEALAQFKKAYDLEPDFEEARFLYGLGLLAVGQTQQSEQILSTVSQDKLLFDDRLISVLASLKRYTDIINIAKERVRRDPTNMQYHMTLAAAYLQSGQRQLAISTIQEMITNDPSFKDQGEYYIKEIQAGRNP